MIIPPDRLEPETLQRLLEEFVTRDGTDNGDETSLSGRVARVQTALHRKQAFIVFDVLSEQCNIVLREDVPAEWLESD